VNVFAKELLEMSPTAAKDRIVWIVFIALRGMQVDRS
jgi:hypothetical protein